MVIANSPGAYQGIEIIPGTDAEIQAQIKSIDASKGGTPTPPPATVITTPTGGAPAVNSPEDEKLARLGLTPEQIKQLNSPEGLDPTSFQNLIGNVENKLKTDNDLVTVRGNLIKHLYDSPLTAEQKAKLPPEIQKIVDTNDKDTIELQLRLINDQISGRGSTLSKSISYLADSYKTNIENAEKERTNAVNTILDFVGTYGSKAPQVLTSLYGPTYLAKLKSMGIDVEQMASTKTLAQLAEEKKVTPSDGSGGKYDNDLDAIIGTVYSTIPTKFGQSTFKDQIAKARDDEDKLNIVAAQVLKGQPAEFKRDFASQAVGIAQIDKALAELDKSLSTGVVQAGKQYLYNLAGKDYDPSLAKISGYITSAIQPYRNSVTGAAWSEQEEQEYQALFGSTRYSPSELRQRLLQTKELLKSKSAEGLNAFANPLGVYEQPFNVGTFAPSSGYSDYLEILKLK